MTRFMNQGSDDPHDTHDEASDHFSQALDAFLHGDPDALNDLDPQMRATVVQMYQWADLAGVGQVNLPEVAKGEIPMVTPAPLPSAVPAPNIRSTTNDNDGDHRQGEC